MSYNGSGTFVINTAGQPVVSGTVISSTAFNALTADLATGLSTAITKDGQTTPTANIPMGNNKITGLAVGTAATDAANLSQVQSTVAKLVGSVSGVDTITGTMSPTLAAYAAGQMFYFVAAGANTGAVTINIDSLGAKSITRDGTTALAAGDIQSGEVCVIVYDGTQFQLVNGASQSASIVTENLTVNKATVLNESGGDNDTRIEGDTDANLVFVDASTDRVMIGGNNPASKFQVAGQVRISGLSAGNTALVIPAGDILGDVSSGAFAIGNYGDASSEMRISTRGFTTFRTGATDGTNGTEQMRLNSTGLGIGTSSPAAKLHSFIASSGRSWSPAATTAGLFERNGDVGITLSAAASSNATINFGSASSETVGRILYDNSSVGGNFMAFQTNSAERMRLDASGNLGLGVTPSAWGSGIKALDINTVGGINASTGTTLMSLNAYYNGSNWIYKTTGTSAYYEQTLGKHAWYTAASGTAGNAITFTQAMTLDASGNWMVGATSALGRATIVQGATSNTDTLVLKSPNASGNGSQPGIQFLRDTNAVLAKFYADTNSGALITEVNGSERARITSGGDFLVGLTSGGKFSVSYGGNDTHFGLGANYDNYITAGSSGVTIFRNTSTERARITSGGNFLINNTSATDSKLIVTGGGTTSASYSCIFEDSGGEDLFWARNDGLINTGTKASSPYYYVVGGTNRDLYIDNSGAIGITTSVRASKTNISPVVDTDWLLQLNPVTFYFRKKDADGNYTDEADGPLKHGLIAEEVEEVNADLCFYDDENKGGALRGVNYSHLVTPMLKLIQKQQAAIAALEAKVAALEAK